jgi:hypothetical protein
VSRSVETAPIYTSVHISDTYNSQNKKRFGSIQARFQIDRRSHFDYALQQQEQDSRDILEQSEGVSLSGLCHIPSSYDENQESNNHTFVPAVPDTRQRLYHVRALHHLEHLSRVVDMPESTLIVMAVYTSSCGICSGFLNVIETIYNELYRHGDVSSDHGGVETAGRIQRAVFVKHNIVNEYDMRSDISQVYNLKAVPCLLFFIDGAMVLRVNPMADIRRVSRSSYEISDEFTQLHGCVLKILQDLTA